MFEDAVLAFSCGSAEVVCGQETPEGRGFVATGTQQGMYRAVPCVQVKAAAQNLRMVTVIVPGEGCDGPMQSETDRQSVNAGTTGRTGARGVYRVEASCGIDSEDILLFDRCGEVLHLRESDLMRDI